MAFDEIAERGMEHFWTQDDRTINQLLHRLMGKRRFVVNEGVIVGVADAPARKKRY
jgi:hypothetical protein